MSDVTIIIPVFNRESYLPRLFDSIRKLTYSDLHIILVDNDSSDDSLSCCLQFAKEAPMPVTVLRETTPGACAARNKGLREATTGWVYFFDSDDEMSADFLDILIPQAEGADVLAFPVNMEVNGKFASRDFVVSNSVAADILSSTLSTISMLFRREWLLQIGGWNENVPKWNDWELGVRTLLHKPRIKWFSEQAFHHIYVHEDSLTGKGFGSTLNSIRKAMQVVENELTTKEDKNALFLRSCIVQGQLLKEGNHEKVSYGAPSSRCMKALGWFLTRYVALGGRGAWRIALKMCSCQG